MCSLVVTKELCDDSHTQNNVERTRSIYIMWSLFAKKIHQLL